MVAWAVPPGLSSVKQRGEASPLSYSILSALPFLAHTLLDAHSHTLLRVHKAISRESCLARDPNQICREFIGAAPPEK